MKACIKCAVELTGDNWAPDQRRNYVNKCRGCVKAEKRAYQKEWGLKNPGKASAAAKRCAARLRASDPVRSRARLAYGDCRKRAQRCGLPFDLTAPGVTDLMRAQVTCPYFGWGLTYEVGKARTLASVDRVDSAKGYTFDNVQIVSYLANLMKSNATPAELAAFARGVLGVAR